jgi:hypothetical protein
MPPPLLKGSKGGSFRAAVAGDGVRRCVDSLVPNLKGAGPSPPELENNSFFKLPELESSRHAPSPSPLAEADGAGVGGDRVGGGGMGSIYRDSR